MPHNSSLTLNAVKETIIKKDSLTKVAGDYYSKSKKVTVGKINFDSVVYTFNNNKLNSVYYLMDKPFINYEYDYSSTKEYLTKLYGEPKSDNNADLWLIKTNTGEHYVAMLAAVNKDVNDKIVVSISAN